MGNSIVLFDVTLFIYILQKLQHYIKLKRSILSTHIYIYLFLLKLRLAAEAIDSATPPGVVLILGLFLSSAPITLSASSLVTDLSLCNFSVAF